MNKIDKTSINTGNENLDKLRRVFPQFIKENKIDFDALKKFFEDQAIVAGEEKYGLNWAGKNNAFKLIRTPSVGTLTPQEKESKDWDKTENLFIEGDNLEALKLLQKHYREKIKMIYIDPPYNTGKDFIYKDNYTENISDYYEKTGQSKNGIKMTTNPESAGRYHSDWLTMMYPRLFLARNLLKEDGVIFISIDDNEVANLRLIMDEIFGEENFRNTIFVSRIKKNIQETDTVKSLNQGVNYVLCYSKSENTTILPPKRFQMKAERWHAFDAPGIRSTMEYDLLGQKPPRGRHWMYEKVRALAMIKSDDLRLSNTQKPQYRLAASDETNLDTNWTDLVESDSTWINNGGKNPKLIRRMLEMDTDKESIILDFFAGSGTTAQAVMELNLEDGGDRKWICVQLPEATDEESEAYKAGYKTIAEIARERIRRAGKKISKGDIDFKSLSLSKSNYRQWNLLTDKNDEQKLKKQMKLFLEKPLVDNYDEKSVVYEILLKEGYDLNSKVNQEKNGDIKYWQVVDEDKKLLVTFEKKITKDQVETLKLTEEDTFVCLDSALDDTTKINIGRNLNVKVI